MKRSNIALLLLCLSFSTTLLAQEQGSLGDLARQLKAKKEAARFGGVQLGGPPPLAAPGEPLPVYFLRMSGKAVELTAVSLNGEKIHGGKLVTQNLPHMLPELVTSKLRDGMNVLEVEYISDPNEGLNIWVEERRRGASPITVATFKSLAGDSQGDSKKKLVPFQAHPRTAPPLVLTEDDRQALRKLVEDYYHALDRRDTAAVSAFLAPAAEEARAIYPEVMDWLTMGDKMTTALIQDKQFKMLPWEESALQFDVQGNYVKVKRSDGKPLLSSVEVQEDVSQMNKPGDQGKILSLSSKIAPTDLPFKKIDGRWRMALPYNF